MAFILLRFNNDKLNYFEIWHSSGSYIQIYFLPHRKTLHVHYRNKRLMLL